MHHSPGGHLRAAYLALSSAPYLLVVIDAAGMAGITTY